MLQYMTANAFEKFRDFFCRMKTVSLENFESLQNFLFPISFYNNPLTIFHVNYFTKIISFDFPPMKFLLVIFDFFPRFHLRMLKRVQKKFLTLFTNFFSKRTLCHLRTPSVKYTKRKYLQIIFLSLEKGAENYQNLKTSTIQGENYF